MNVTYVELANAMNMVANTKDNYYKKRVFWNFAKLINEYKSIDLEFLSTLKGVGNSCIEMATEFLTNGSIKRVEDHIKTIDSDIIQIPGIGPSRLHQLLLSGYRSKDELISLGLKEGDIIPNTNIRVTNQMEVGLEFMAHTDRNRMSRDEYESIALPIKSSIEEKYQDIKVSLVGSYRRLKNDIGDIDIAIFLDDIKNSTIIIEYISNLLDRVVVKGPTKISGIKSRRQVDFRIVNKSMYGPMMMYFTGPAEFNINMRLRAISEGYKLSEYGLFKNDKRIDNNTEESIFKLLNMKYFSPQKREQIKF